MRHIVIIGNGIAGITCARQVRKRSDDRITVISAETDHFFSRTALMYIYMGHMKYEHTKPYEDFFWAKNRIELRRGFVRSVDTEKKELRFDDGSSLSYDVLVLATGSVTQTYSWPGQDLKGVRGLYSLGDLESMQAETKDCQQAVIVGGGLIGIEMAEMLHSRKIPVRMLLRDRHYWPSVLSAEEATLVQEQLDRNHISVSYLTELTAIQGDSSGHVKSVVTSTGETIACSFVGIATGVSPNISFLKGSAIAIKRGVLVNRHFETNVPDVYAIGDCAESSDPPPGRNGIEQVWYTGRMHGETLALTLTGRKTAYQPGPWFNSAKFFDLEYQTYGLQTSEIGEDQIRFFWKHPNRNHGLALVYNKSKNILTGVNSFGIRLRHETFDRWLKEEKSADEVLSMLGEAFFDAEFSKNHHQAILDAYKQQTGTVLIRNKRRTFFPRAGSTNQNRNLL